MLRWEEVPTPTPGPAEVLVRLHAVSVNRTLDLQVRQDGGNYGTVLPLVLGNDPSGVVVAVGPGVEQRLLNQGVAIFGGIRCGACEPCRMGQYTQCRRPLMLGVQCWGCPAGCTSSSTKSCHCVKLQPLTVWWQRTCPWVKSSWTLPWSRCGGDAELSRVPGGDHVHVGVQLSPISTEIVECVARAVRLRILPRTGFANSAEPPWRPDAHSAVRPSAPA